VVVDVVVLKQLYPTSDCFYALEAIIIKKTPVEVEAQKRRCNFGVIRAAYQNFLILKRF
jgi:hypothetical protein